MSSNKTKCIIIGIMTLFLLSGASPIFTVSADDLLTTLNNGELDIGISGGKLYEVEDDLHVTVTADGGSTIVVGAEVTFSGATLTRTTGEDGSVRFPIGEIVDGDKEYEDHTITASHPEYNTATRGVQIWNRCIKIASIPSTVVDGDTFFVRFKDHHDDWIGGTFHFNSQSYSVLPTGAEIQAPYLPEAPDGTVGEDESFSVYSKKIGYKKSEIHTITVINKNHAVFTPSKPSGPLSVDVGDENVNGNKYSTSVEDPDSGGVKIRFKWGDGEETDWIQASSGQKVERSHYWYDTGMYTITVKAKDLHEPAEVKTSACVVFVGNKQPSRASTPTGKNEVDVGSQATFSSSASDPEGHSLKFCFDWGDGDKSWTDLDCCSSSHFWDQSGTYSIQAKAMDEYGLESARWSNVKYVVVGNLDPIITSFKVKFVRTGVRKIIVTAEDPNEADNVQFYVNWDDGYSSGWSGGTKRVREKGGYYHTYEKTHEFKEKGQYTILVKIRDDAGDSDDSATKTVTINIGADAGMSMEIKKAEADVIYKMVPKTIIDENGQALVADDSYSVIANQDGTYDIQQDNQIVQEGVESVEAVQNYVTNNAQTGTTDIPGDDDGNNDNDYNNEPSLSCPSSKSVTEGNSCSFTASASDQDGNSLSITATKISGPGNVSISSGSTNYASYAIDEGQTTTSYASKTITYHSSEDSDCEDGTAKIRVKVTDGHGGSTSKTVTININDDDSCGDDCCFPAGTLINMADGSTKAIEDVQVGEYVLSYNIKGHELTTCKVLETVSPIRKGVYSINNDLVRPTDDHPFYTRKADGRIGWAAINPSHSISGYRMQVMPLKVGDKIFNSDRQWIKIESIEYQPGMIQTYNLEDVSGKSNFFANGILVHNAVDCEDSDSDSSSSSSGGSIPSYSSLNTDFIDVPSGKGQNLHLEFSNGERHIYLGRIPKGTEGYETITASNTGDQVSDVKVKYDLVASGSVTSGNQFPDSIFYDCIIEPSGGELAGGESQTHKITIYTSSLPLGDYTIWVDYDAQCSVWPNLNPEHEGSDSTGLATAGLCTMEFTIVKGEGDKVQPITNSEIVTCVSIQFDGSGTFLNDFYQESEGTLQASFNTYQTSDEAQQKSFLFAESSIIMSLLKIFAEKFPALRNFLLNKGIINNDEELREENDQIDDFLETVPPTSNENAPENNDLTPHDIPVVDEPANIDLPTDENVQENNDITPEDNVPVEEDTSDETETDQEVLTEEDLVFVWDVGDGNFITGVKPVYTYEVKKDSEYETYIDREENLNLYTSYISPSDIPLKNPLPTNEQILAKYYVTLYVIIDKEHILESLEKINEEDLSGFEIVDTDTTTITVKTLNSGTESLKPVEGHDLVLYHF